MTPSRDPQAALERRRATPFAASALLALLSNVTVAGVEPVALWDFTKSPNDLRPPVSRCLHTPGDPVQGPNGYVFAPDKVMGLTYGRGANDELCLAGDVSIWVRAAFGPRADRPLANNDTLASRWGNRGRFSFLLKADHITQTIHLVLSPNGRNFTVYNSGIRIDRTGAFHDYGVVVRPGRDVRFYLDGQLQCTLRNPPPPRVHQPPDDNPPFAIGYNSDNHTPGRDHGTMNGTIAAVRAYNAAIDDAAMAALSDVEPLDPSKRACVLRVRADQPIARVDPFVFGLFLEHFQDIIYGGVFDPDHPSADASGFRSDVQEALKELRPTVIRWPGGNFASAYHWKWGAVPRRYRPVINEEPVWKARETNAFGTPEFIELCRRLDAEPMICVGVGRDPQNPTPEDAAAWVRYCNAQTGPEADMRKDAGYPKPFNVTLWCLGNEVYGRWQIGHYDRPGEYAADVLRYADAMRAADPNVRLIIVGHSYRYDNTIWNRAVLTEPVTRLTDWICYHTYSYLGPHGPRPDLGGAADRLRWLEYDVEAVIDTNRAAARAAHLDAPPRLAITEWNEYAWADPDDNAKPTHYDLAHALFTAGFFNLMLRHSYDITMATYSPAVNARGLIFAAHRGVVRRSTHPVFSLYRAAAGGIAVTVDADVPAIDGYSAPILDAAAVRGPDNVLRLFVVNRDPHQPMKCDVTVDGFPVSSPRGRRLTARSLDAYNDFDHPNDVRIADWPVRWTGPSSPITFPPRSLCVLKLSDAAASPE